ncbi:MAG TPA: hypothetical protein ENI60_02505 [Candidatus Fraserbacteria bacterium]|nr:hypothetical protein [Candidatus Fraserbacteria bacterium]
MGRLIVTTVGTSLLKKINADQKIKIRGMHELCNPLSDPTLYQDAIAWCEDTSSKTAQTQIKTYNRVDDVVGKLQKLDPDFQSLPTTSIKDHRYAAPAEIASLWALKEYLQEQGKSPLSKENGDRVVLLYSDTSEGVFCARCLQTYIDHSGLAHCEWKTDAKCIEGLQAEGPEAHQKWGTAVNNLADLLCEQWEGTTEELEPWLNITGGYKGITPFSSLIGLLSKVPVVYLYETSDRLIHLPYMPIQFKLLEWHEYAHRLKYILELPADKVKERVESLPRWLQNLLQRSNNQYILTPLGRAIKAGYDSERRRITEHTTGEQVLDFVKDETLRRKLLRRFEARHQFLLEGNQIPETVDHGRGHAQRLLEFAEQLLLPLGDDFLTSEELYLLVNCLWLHDIGCAGGSLSIDDQNIPITSPDLTRRLHNLLTEVRLKNHPEKYGFSTDETEERDLIATICKYNRRGMPLCKDDAFEENIYGYEVKISDPIEETTHLSIADNQVCVRTRLLTALLRVIDACDEQRARAGTEEYQAIRRGVTKEEAGRAEERRKLMKKIADNFAAAASTSLPDMDGKDWKDTVKSLRSNSSRSAEENQLLEALTLYWDLYDAAHFKENQDKHFAKHAQIEWARLRPPVEEDSMKHFVLELKPIENACMKLITNLNPQEGEEKGAKEEIEEDFAGAQPVLSQVSISLSVEVLQEGEQT